MAGRSIGVEVSDSGMRLTAAVDTAHGARRWSTRLQEPPSATEAVAQLNALIERALADAAGAETNDQARVGVGVALAGQVDTARAAGRHIGRALGRSGNPAHDDTGRRLGGGTARRGPPLGQRVLSTPRTQRLGRICA